MSQTDADAARIELESGGSKDPFKRLVSGEVLSSLGLYLLASEQFSEADKLANNYVLERFKLTFESNPFIAPLLFHYLQDKYPKDPAVLFFAARKHLQAQNSVIKQREQAIATARSELSMAIAQKNPWPGTHAYLAMMEYNDGKLDRALELCQQELSRNPDNSLAKKVRILTRCRQGKRPDEMIPELEDVLSDSARDAELNLLLGRAYIYKHEYNKATLPSILGLFNQHDRATLNEARAQVFDLIKKADRKQLLAAINRVSFDYSDPGTQGRGFRSTVMRMRLADLFALCSDKDEACSQLKTAMSMHRHFLAPAAYRLGCELMRMHKYVEALAYLNLACNQGSNPVDSQKYRVTRDRLLSILSNYRRNISMQMKTRFDNDLANSINQLIILQSSRHPLE